MPRRIERVNELIQQQIAEIIQENIEAPGVFITITKVDTADNFYSAKVYFSVFPEEQSSKMLDLLIKHTKQLQWLLNRKLSMKFVPNIIFVPDAFSKEDIELQRLLNDDDK